jgi:tRNA pseudouridine-54 N-methylase
MLNFREFQAGPDPFGRKYDVLLKWLQTAISLRHSDTIDVKFILVDESGGRTEKTIALPHSDLRRLSRETGRPLDDPWCARLAQSHLLYLIETGEDIEKDLVTVGYDDLKRHADKIARQEQSEATTR